jgi:hypothetical protein
MRYETFKFIIDNKEKFVFDNATTGGTDTSTDPGASVAVNPNNYLAPIIGGSDLIKTLSIIALVLGIVYLIKLNLKHG